MIYNPNQVLTFGYTNWKNQYNERRVVPIRIFFGKNEYHKEDTWLMEAYCLDRKENRTFALNLMKTNI